jgi:hypothetical protein
MNQSNVKYKIDGRAKVPRKKAKMWGGEGEPIETVSSYGYSNRASHKRSRSREDCNCFDRLK